MVELIALYESAGTLKNGENVKIDKRHDSVASHVPKTPAELPIKVPLRVTEFNMALIRKRAFDAAIGRFEPSRNPHKPPIARPRQYKYKHQQIS